MRATAKAGLWGIRQQISIHALREEGDAVRKGHHMEKENFYPRPPRGGRRGRCGCIRLILTFLSTPSARRATSKVQGGIRVPEISIHALREEGDDVPSVWMTWYGYFYPRPPRGGRPGVVFSSATSMIFLSTPSARRATSAFALSRSAGKFLSTPSARRATNRLLSPRIKAIFLSTPSARRATKLALGLRWVLKYFYPRPPRGGRPGIFFLKLLLRVFLSTPSARRATPSWPRVSSRRLDFYPRPPRGGRRLRSPLILTASQFLSTPSARRATFHFLISSGVFEFLSTPSARRATFCAYCTLCTVLYFYPRPPRGGRLAVEMLVRQAS